MKYNFICTNCKHQFSEAEIEKGDAYEFMGSLERNIIQVCPICKSEDFVETNEIIRRIECVLDDYEMTWDELEDLQEEEIK